MTSLYDANTDVEPLSDTSVAIFPVAIGCYAHPDLPDLDDVEEHVATIAGLLADYGGVAVPWTTPMRDRGADAVFQRLDAWATSNTARSVLYWAGHGKSTSTTATLAHANSPLMVSASDVSPRAVAEAIARHAWDHDGHWVIAVVDACFSRRFVQLVTAELDSLMVDRHVLLIGTSGDGATTLGRFTDTLAPVLRLTFGGERQISLRDLANGLEDAAPEILVRPLRVERSILTNTRFTMSGAPVDVIDEVQAAMQALTPDERRHFVLKAQAAELGEQSWYFQGRARELTLIAQWLRTSDDGLLVVTGPAGSGKSALLGNLLVQSNPTLRAVLVRQHLIAVAPEQQRPLDGTIDVAIHLAGLSTTDTVRRIAATVALGAPPTSDDLAAQVSWLIAEVRWLLVPAQLRPLDSRERAQLTILVDALDEAVDPIMVAIAILRPLADAPGVRVIVGTRASTHEGPDHRATAGRDLLDALQSERGTVLTVGHDPAAVGSYVRVRLANAVERGVLDADPASIAALSAAIEADNRHFLFARLAVHDVIANRRMPTGDALREVLACTHRDLFIRALARLSERHPSYEPILRTLAYSRGRGVPIRDGICAAIATAMTDTAITSEQVLSLLSAAAPYVLLDQEHEQTVYRLAHRTFAEYFIAETSHTHADRSVHEVITSALIDHANRHSCNPYLRHYLTGHAGEAGQSAWHALADHPAIVDQLDPLAVTSDAMRTAFGAFPLPAPITGIVGACHQLAAVAPGDRPGLRQLAMARHANIGHPGTPPQSSIASNWSVRWAALRKSPTHLTLAGRNGWVKTVVSVAMPDGRLLLVVATIEGSVQLWDPLAGVLIGHPSLSAGRAVSTLAVFPAHDRTLVAMGTADGAVHLWDPVANTSVGRPLTGLSREVVTMVAIPLTDGQKILAAGDATGSLRLWDPARGKATGRRMAVRCKKVSALTTIRLPDGRVLLVVGDTEGSVRLWDPAADVQIGQPLALSGAAVSSLATTSSREGHPLLAVGTADGSIIMCDPIVGTRVENGLARHVSTLASVPLPDGRTLLAMGRADGSVGLWDPTSHESRRLSGPPHRVSALAPLTLADGRSLVASGSADGSVRLWDPSTATAMDEPAADQQRDVTMVTVVPMSDGPTLVASGSADGSVRLWDPTAHKSTGRPLAGLIDAVSAVAVPMADKRTLVATASADGSLRWWDPSTCAPVGRPFADRGSEVSVLVALISPDGRPLVAGGGWDGLVRVWDPLSGELVGEPVADDLGDADRVSALVVVPSPDGRSLVAAASSGGLVRLCDPVAGAPVGEPLARHIYHVNALAAVTLPDGTTFLAGGGWDGKVRLWDPFSGRLVWEPLEGHTDQVSALAAVPLSDGRTVLASGSGDGTVRLWDPVKPRDPAVVRLGAAVWAVAPICDDTIAVGLPDGIAMISLSEPVTRWD